MRKSYCLLLVAFAFSFFSFAQSNSNELIETALTKAKIENKQVLVNYLSTSCKKSEQVVEKMNDLDVKSILNSDYIVVNITIPKEETKEFVNCSNPMKLFTESNCDQISFPFWYVLDPSGNFIETSYINEKNTAQLVSLR